ncbi:MAG TPA: hypothetical protein VG244_01815 [Acidimicrobiales bacterium]|nr:hypothetical protein [Acidimicrobiales bacterium]
MAVCGGTSAERSAFTRQGQKVARITSKFVVDIYDCGSDDDRPFVVFERPASTLADAIGAGDKRSIADVSLVEVARELEEAVHCLRLAGVDFGNLRPEIVGVNEAGHLRLSPWPLGGVDVGAQVPRPVTGDILSDEDRILAFLAPATGTSMHDVAALRRFLERPKDTVYSAPLLGAWVAGRFDGFPTEHLSDSAATAQVMVDRNVLSRPVIRSHMTMRSRPRSHYLAAAAAAIVAIATLGAVSSLMVQAGIPGIKGRNPAAAATSKSSGTSTSRRSNIGNGAGSPSAPVLSQAMSEPLASQYGQPSPAPRPTPLVSPSTNVVSLSGAPVAPTAGGGPNTSTTSTTVPGTTTTTTTVSAATTTTTTVPATTTTTTPAAHGAAGP